MNHLQRGLVLQTTDPQKLFVPSDLDIFVVRMVNQDLWLRLFNSQFFDEHLALRHVIYPLRTSLVWLSVSAARVICFARGGFRVCFRVEPFIFFSTSFVCRYIYRKRGGVHEYLCNRLFHLSASSIEDILLQLCEMAANRPVLSHPLQQSLVGLCGRSTEIALKVPLSIAKHFYFATNLLLSFQGVVSCCLTMT